MIDQIVKITSSWLFNIVAVFLLLSCSSPSVKAPISSVDQPASLTLDKHVVSRGDTLYAIAWRYDLNFRRLASLNGIRPPYTITPGQVLRLVPDTRRAAAASSAVSSAKLRAKKAPTKPSASTKRASSKAKTETAPKVRAKSSPSKKPKTVTKKTISKKRLKNKSLTSSLVKKSSSKSSSLVWSWPIRGAVIKRFKSAKGLNKGIDIAAKLGESVHAAADGVVVYAGGGLRGYGKLLIVKHKSSYLSAYAHNRRLLAKEGDTVKRGQKIAEVGSSGTDRAKLHFEIRRDGVPVDPEGRLPK